MAVVDVCEGAIVRLDDGRHYLVAGWSGPDQVILEDTETGETRPAKLPELRSAKPSLPKGVRPVDSVSESHMELAKEHFEYLRPILAGHGGRKEIEQAAERAQVHRATIYRWLRDFRQGQVLTNLARKQRSDRGKTRLAVPIEALLKRAVKYYATAERPSYAEAYRHLKTLCHKHKSPVPSLDTLKQRIWAHDPDEIAKKRLSRRAREKLRLNGNSIKGADHPYALIQIDHTKVDIELLDDDRKVVLNRPWITVAIDVNTRMCVGFYISFDPPGTIGTGQCLIHAFQDKGAWLKARGLEFQYPCQGLASVIHADNAREFRGNTLKFVCDKYDVDLKFRKLKQPQYGAHIERLMGTFMTRVHALPGTTFSNSGDKGEYDSAERAALTFTEFEKWFAVMVVGAYHNEPHGGLDGQTPLQRYKKAMAASDAHVRLVTDLELLYYDFLPKFSVTVQTYGIQLDNFKYSGDVLRRWVGARDPKYPRRARRFLVGRDPRDISRLFFLDPDAGTYHRVPFRNLEHPPISIWEANALRAQLLEENGESVDEDALFRAYAEMRQIVEDGVRQTKRAKRFAKLQARRGASPQPAFGHAKPGRPQEVQNSTADQTGTTAAPPPGSPPPDPPDTAVPPQRRQSPVPFDEVERF